MAISHNSSMYACWHAAPSLPYHSTFLKSYRAVKLSLMKIGKENLLQHLSFKWTRSPEYKSATFWNQTGLKWLKLNGWFNGRFLCSAKSLSETKKYRKYIYETTQEMFMLLIYGTHHRFWILKTQCATFSLSKILHFWL